MADVRIGRLFPAGGPVPPDLVIGRKGEIEEITRRVREGIHTLVTGPRRIGKTTVCDAVCGRARHDHGDVVDIEVPERADSTTLLQLIIDRCNRISNDATARKLWRTATPFIEALLREEGIPLDLSQIGQEQELPTRAVLSLPLKIAERSGQRVVFFLDELQRVVDYGDGAQVLGDLVDLYSGKGDVVVLVDGSDERALDGMLGPPAQIGKLCDRVPLAPTIPTYTWRDCLPERFAQAGLTITGDALEAIVAFGEGRPYATMTASRYAALNARKLGSDDVGTFEAEQAIAETKRHLEEDG